MLVGCAVPERSIRERRNNEIVLYYCKIENSDTFLLYISESICKFMCNFVSGNKENRNLLPETKFHIQKYDGLENIKKPSQALELWR